MFHTYLLHVNDVTLVICHCCCYASVELEDYTYKLTAKYLLLMVSSDFATSYLQSEHFYYTRLFYDWYCIVRSTYVFCL